MSRRRYQKGCVYRRGDVWIGRWREDVINANGEVERRLRFDSWSVAEYPTKRSVQRELQRKLAEVNAKNYRAKPQTSFAVFAEKWKLAVLPNLKPSTQSAIRSQLRKHLVPTLGHIAMTNITGEVLQSFVSKCLALSPKTTKNLAGTLRIMWKTAKAWRLVEHNPFEDLSLPKRQRHEARCFTAEEMRRIVDAAKEPHKTFYWLAAETGLRAGELCGLRVADVGTGIVHVRQSVWRGQAQDPKTGNAVRSFAVSSRLTERLRVLCAGRDVLRFVFQTSRDTPWDANLVVKRKLVPLCRSLAIERGGLHAFRHGNATVMDQVDVPTKVRQTRLGHGDIETTMGYTHAVSADDQRAAVEIERMIFGAKPQTPALRWQVPGGNA